MGNTHWQGPSSENIETTTWEEVPAKPLWRFFTQRVGLHYWLHHSFNLYITRFALNTLIHFSQWESSWHTRHRHFDAFCWFSCQSLSHKNTEGAKALWIPSPEYGTFHCAVWKAKTLCSGCGRFLFFQPTGFCWKVLEWNIYNTVSRPNTHCQKASVVTDPKSKQSLNHHSPAQDTDAEYHRCDTWMHS